MHRLVAAAALAAALALGALTVTAHADTWRGYAGPGEWFSAGEGHGSTYDHQACWFWIDNTFAKAPSAWGLVTFINTSGGWSYTRQAYGNIFRVLPEHTWQKKLHCKNNSGSAYQGGCFGYLRNYPCA
jgi:hypothetical protein